MGKIIAKAHLSILINHTNFEYCSEGMTWCMSGDKSLPRSCGLSISCTDCGTHHVIYSPESEYVSTMLDLCPRGDYYKSFFDCINCDKRNTFYWHKKHREDRQAT